MPYLGLLAAFVYCLTWFIFVGSWAVFYMLTRPPVGHGFEFGVTGAQYAVAIIAVACLLYSPVIIVTLIVLGRVDRDSGSRLVGLSILAAIASGSILVGSYFLPFDLLPSGLPTGIAMSAVFAISVAATVLVMFGGRRLGYIRRYSRPGYCEECGYDLRASQGVSCPECGLPIPHRV